MNISNLTDNELKKYISFSNDTVKQVINKLNDVYGLFQIILDDENRLIGTVTDGDIRRGILKGYNINDKIELFMNKAPVFSNEDNDKNHINILSTVEREPFFLPILTKDKKLKSLLIKIDENRINQAIIMAGGMGKRLGNLTKNIPKPMLEIKGKPIIEHCLSRLEEGGIETIYVSVNYLADQIIKYLNSRNSISNIIPINEEKRLGTIGSLSLISDKITGPIIVMNADLLTNVSINAMASYHLDGNYSATIAGAVYENTIPCGVLKSNQLGHLEFIEEKPVVNYMVAGGLYILNQEVYKLLKKNEFFDIPDLLNNSVKKKFINTIFPIHEKWRDIGKIEEYNKAIDEN